MKNTELYILTGDVYALDYVNFGAFTSKSQALKTAKQLIQNDPKGFKKIIDEFEFTGLAIYQQNLNKLNANALKYGVNYDFNTKQITLDQLKG